MESPAPIQSVTELVDRLGGYNETGKLFGVGGTAVCNWIADGRLPTRRYQQALAIARERGLTLSDKLFDFVPASAA